jgi:Cu/Ag efflux pump CusA
MIRRTVDFALYSRFLVLAIAILLFAWGVISFKNLPIEAYPDVANNYVQVNQTGVIMLEYMNQLRARGRTIEDSAIEGAVLRLRPIMMTMLVATLGLLPAALSHAIGSDSQRPFAIVIVGGLIAYLVMSIFLLPTLYVWVAGDSDVLPEAELDAEV